MDSIPVKLRPLVHRLEAVPDLSRKDLISILFVVRLGDILHRSFYGTFLTQSLVRTLCEELSISDLVLEVEVFHMRWSYRQGTVFTVAHRMIFDYDMYTVFAFTKIARTVLQGSLSPKEALVLIKAHESKADYNPIEGAYRTFPHRAAIIPIMSFTCATVFFGGTWYDLGFSFCCGAVAGIIAYLGTRFEELNQVVDYLVAISTAMIGVVSMVAFPDHVCFSAQLLGTLYWFFYGTAFVISLYELTNNQLMTGLTRLVQAIVRSYGLALGSLLGVWFAAYSDDRWDSIGDECSTKQSQIEDIWFILLFPLSAISCLMQFRVTLGHFLLCLSVQTIAYGSQYVLGTVWSQPDFLANMIPAYLATLASAALISVMHHLPVASLPMSEYMVPYKKDDDARLRGDVEEHQSDGNEQLESVDQNEIASSSSTRSAASNQGESTSGARPAAGIATLDLNIIGYIDTDLSYDISSEEKVAFAKSDMWFCLLPALYLLVPGSKILQAAFLMLLGSFSGESQVSDYEALGVSLLVIGLGQVIGLRLGFVTLWMYHSIYARLFGESRHRSS